MRRGQARGTGFFTTAALAAALTVLVTQMPLMAGPRAALRGALAPAEAVSTGFEGAAGDALGVFGDIATLRAENRRLAQENSVLRGQVGSLRAAGSENESLRRSLAFERSFGHRLVAAAVIGRGPDSFTRTLTIDRGTADGVQPGMVVVTGAGLVGRVRESGPRSATVQTVADPLTRVNAYVVPSNLEGTVSGGGGPLRMEVVPRADVAARPGDWALTSGLGGGYPRGIPIGQVTSYERRDTAVSSAAELAWANDLALLASVLVVADFHPVSP